MAIDIADWLRGLGLEQYAPAFRDNDIDGDVLPELTADDLVGLGVASIGHRRKLLGAIAALREASASGDVLPARPVAALPQTPEVATAAAERRLVTIMFCDLVGSTELATRLDPEDLREVIGVYHRTVADVLGRHGGFVAKYMGDGILAYFGYPQAHEEDAEQAVRAGLAIVEAVGRLGLAQRLEVRLGIATGLVVIGDLLGAGAAQEQAVVGETPNLAARLQSLATADAIVIADATRRHVGGLFELRDLGPQALRGFAGATAAWQVVGESGVASRFEALRSRETPLIGRDEEIDLLLRRWSQAEDGDGRVVLLSAEPGIGKSRLAEALEERISDEAHLRLRYFCSPHHQDSALHPIVGQLEHAAGFARDDTPTHKAEKLAALIDRGEGSAEDQALLAELLSLPAPATLTLTPQQKKEKTFAALLRQLDNLARRQPVLMVFEDLHWMDATSLELLDRLIGRVEQLPVLLIATFRPEFQPSWVGQAHVTMLALSRLGRREGAVLVQRLAGNLAGLPDEIIGEIIDRTDGVPLFLEEVTKAILETAEAASSAAARGAVAAVPGARSAVPATLQASLMARLDRLGAAAREIAQTGAAIGRDFSYELVSAVSPRGEAETRAALDQLVAAGLVFQRGTPPAAEYQFKHALVQDTAYGTLLRGPRQALHGRIAAAIERRMPELVAREPELLAYHLAEADQPERAAEFWGKAGELAVRRAANREAVGHFRRALGLVEKQPEGAERWHVELAVLTKLAPPLMAVLGWSAPEVGEIVERAAATGRRLPSSTELAPAIGNLWIFNTASGNKARAREISADLFRIAQEIEDDGVLLQAHHCAWATEFFSGAFRLATEHTEAGRALYDRERHAHHRHVYLGHDPGVCSLNFGHAIGAACGYFERSERFHAEGLALAQQLDHAPSIANTLWRHCEVHVVRRDVPTVLATATELVTLTEARGLRQPRPMGLCYLGWAMALSGDPREGLAHVDAGLRALVEMGARMNVSFMNGLRAEMLAAAGRHAEGLEEIDKALMLAGEIDETAYDAWLHRVRGELLLHLRGAADAAEAFHDGLVLARRQEAKGFELVLALSLARLLAEQGRRDEARALLAPVYSWFTEGFDTLPLRQAKALLDDLA